MGVVKGVVSNPLFQIFLDPALVLSHVSTLQIALGRACFGFQRG